MLSKEEFEALPEKARAAFVQDGDEFVPAKDAKLKQTLNDLDSKYKSLQSKLDEQERQKAADIEAARQAALEEARTKGDVKAIEERYQQQMADLEKRTAERVRAEVEQELTSKQAEQQASSLADKIGLTLAHDKDDGEAIADLIRHRVKIDPATGKEVYYSADGSALSVDRAGFENELKKEARFKRLIKGEVATTGGGKANGSAGTGSASSGTGKVDGSKDDRAAYFAKKFNIR